MIRNLLWDLDGALFDTSPAKTYALSKAMTELGCSVPLNWIDGLVRQSYDQCLDRLGKRARCDRQEIHAAYQRYYAAIPCSNQVIFPGAIEVCAWVWEHGGCNYALTDLNETISRHFLIEHNLNLFFKGIYLKPNRQTLPASEWLYDLVVKENLDPDATLVVAHHPRLIQAGRQAGVKTCSYGEESDSSKADWHVVQYDQILALLQQ